MRVRAALLPTFIAAALVAGVPASGAAQQIIIGRAGPASASDVLTRETGLVHTIIPPGSTAADLPADSTYASTVFVLGRDATVNGTVHGDVVVIGGDLYMHPGAHVDGRAVAIGGGAYNSSLAVVGAGLESYRDFTYQITQVSGGYQLDYQPLTVSHHHGLSIPGWIGLNAPGYDRTDGLSIPISFKLPGADAFSLVPVVTYRSELGRLDPQLSATLPAGADAQVDLSVGRGTMTNDAWIRSNVANSIESFVFGNDARNYYRASFADARVTRRWNPMDGAVSAYVAGRFERDRSVRPALFATGGPWSIVGRHDSTHMLRPNPQVPSGDLAGAKVGASVDWTAGGVMTSASADEEVSHFASATFSQTTVDASLEFATFGAQSFREHAHGVLTTGGATPLERYVYLGGSGTISTLDMLSMGGDDMVFFDSRYTIPVPIIQLPMLGAPAVVLRHVMGAAGVRGLPSLEQAVGFRVAVSVLYGEVMVDPATHHTHLGAGISMTR